MPGSHAVRNAVRMIHPPVELAHEAPKSEIVPTVSVYTTLECNRAVGKSRLDSTYMFAELSFAVCAGCGSRDLRPAKVRGIFETLASRFLIPYRCRACGRRQLKLTGVRISAAKRVVLKPTAATPASHEKKRHVSSAAFVQAPETTSAAETAEPQVDNRKPQPFRSTR
jgi:hypothetical protein